VFDPAWTPDGKIVYGVVSGESRALWLMDADGGNRRQITPEGEVVRYPSVTNDGRYIIYQSTRGGRTDIWRVGPDGSKLQQLTTDGASYQPHGSPDGLWVVYVSEKERERRVWRVNADGGEPLRLTDTASNWPRISPDGKWIACALVDERVSPRTQLAIIPADGGPPSKTFTLTKTGSFNNGIRWSSDSQAIIFRDYRIGVWRQPINGGPPQPLKSFAKLKIHDMDWTLDGKQVVYTMGAWVRVVTLISDFR
jgi:Tol biopolymer transport system component